MSLRRRAQRPIGSTLCGEEKAGLSHHGSGASSVVKSCGANATLVWRILRVSSQLTPDDLRHELEAALRQHSLSVESTEYVVPITRVALWKDAAPALETWPGLEGRSSPILFAVKSGFEEGGDGWLMVHPSDYGTIDPFGEYAAIAFESPRKRHALSDVLYSVDARALRRRLQAMVEWLHRQGVAHCDLKADNLMLDEDLSSLQFIDFGHSKVDGPGLGVFLRKDWRQVGLLLLRRCHINLADLVRDTGQVGVGHSLSKIAAGDEIASVDAALDATLRKEIEVDVLSAGLRCLLTKTASPAEFGPLVPDRTIRYRASS